MAKRVQQQIVLSGKPLLWCMMCCYYELFDEQTRDRIDAEIESEAGLSFGPLTWEEHRRIRNVIPSSMRRPLEKRAEYLARNCNPVVYRRIFVWMSMAMNSIRETEIYRVQSRWNSSLVQAVMTQEWTPKTNGESDEASLKEIAGSLAYMTWVEEGGSPDLMRWLAHYYAGGCRAEFPTYGDLSF